MKKNIYIGVAWPYVNGDLHVGHLAGYLIPADIYARYHRLIGNSVLMTSGSDCFGTPITVEADKRSLSPTDIVNEYHPNHVKLFKLYGISYDLYTTTTTENHREVVQEMFVAMAQQGYIVKDSTEQYYSSTENKFLPDRYVEGECPHCGYKDARGDQCDNCARVLEAGQLKSPRSKFGKTSVELKKTEHYFIDWPRLQKDFLEKYVEEKSGAWRAWVAAETKGWLKKGLEKRAITRDLSWGVSIPVEALKKTLGEKFIIDNVENKRIYVWFDAVIGYLSSSKEWAGNLGKNEEWKKWWESQSAAHYYFMGKDNLVFHTLFWPGQLWGSYGDSIHTPDNLPINHYLNLEGQKFSKSRGVIIDSSYIGTTYGVDPVRFYLTYIMPESNDANFSWNEFVEVTNNILIGKIGNLINRVAHLSKGMSFSDVTQISPEMLKTIQELVKKSFDYLSAAEFKLYLQTVIKLADEGNEYIARTEPWKITDAAAKKNTLAEAFAVVIAMAVLLKPLIPEAIYRFEDMFEVSVQDAPTDKDFEKWILKRLNHIQINREKIVPLFTKIDPEIVEAEKAKLNLKTS